MEKINQSRYRNTIFYSAGKSLNGFTLLEIAVVLSILGVISVFAIGITGSIQSTAKIAETRIRMDQIVKKAKSYYRGHGTLPGDKFTATSDIITGVPVGPDDLNM